jgi:hypothetical protein
MDLRLEHYAMTQMIIPMVTAINSRKSSDLEMLQNTLNTDQEQKTTILPW